MPVTVLDSHRVGTRAIADHVAARTQVATGPLPHLLVREVLYRRQAHIQGAAIGAGLHQLVLHEPRRFVGHDQLALERQGVDGIPVLCQQVHGQ